MFDLDLPSQPLSSREYYERYRKFSKLEKSNQLKFLSNFIIDIQTQEYQDPSHTMPHVVEACILSSAYNGLDDKLKFSTFHSFRTVLHSAGNVLRHISLADKPFGSHLKIDKQNVARLTLSRVKPNVPLYKAFEPGDFYKYNAVLVRVSHLAKTPEFIEKCGVQLSDTLSDIGCIDNELTDIRGLIRLVIERHLSNGAVDEHKVIDDLNAVNLNYSSKNIISFYDKFKYQIDQIPETRVKQICYDIFNDSLRVLLKSPYSDGVCLILVLQFASGSRMGPISILKMNQVSSYNNTLVFNTVGATVVLVKEKFTHIVAPGLLLGKLIIPRLWIKMTAKQVEFFAATGIMEIFPVDVGKKYQNMFDTLARRKDTPKAYSRARTVTNLFASSFREGMKTKNLGDAKKQWDVTFEVTDRMVNHEIPRLVPGVVKKIDTELWNFDQCPQVYFEYGTDENLTSSINHIVRVFFIHSMMMEEEERKKLYKEYLKDEELVYEFKAAADRWKQRNDSTESSH